MHKLTKKDLHNVQADDGPNLIMERFRLIIIFFINNLIVGTELKHLGRFF